ncbi:hypothetical protein GTO10_02170 [Candidatus Saccharibacteria bacterium]|nr:hypothetical protein [Candidatus Saccharibacteria bacterium]
MRIYLCRHAQEAEDGGITRLGERQSLALARFLAGEGAESLYSSDLKRAVETAKVVGDGLGLGVKIVPEFREISTNSPEDWTEYVKTHHMELDFPVGGKESLNEVMKRGRKALDKVIRQEKGKRVAIIAHGVFTKALLYSLGYRDQLIKNSHVANTGVTILEGERGNILLVKFNHYGHLFPLRLREIVDGLFRKIFKKR